MVDLNLLIAGVLAIAGTIAGSVLGVFLSQRIQRPKPLILIDEVGASLEDTPPGIQIRVDSRLMERCIDCPGIDEPDFRVDRPTVGEVDYVRYLAAESAVLSERIEAMPAQEAEATEILQLLRNGDWDHLDIVLARASPRIWDISEEQWMREEFSFPDPEPDYSTRKQFHSYTETEAEGRSGPYVLVTAFIGGAKNIGAATFTRRHPNFARSLEFNRRAIRAVAYRDVPQLTLIFSQIERYVTKFNPIFRVLRDDIAHVLSERHRVRVAGRIANGGGTSFSLLPSAAVQLMVLPASATGEAHFDVALKQVDSDWKSTIVALPGATVGYLAISKLPFSELDQNTKRAMELSNQSFRLRVTAIGYFAKASKEIESEARPFPLLHQEHA